MSTTGKCDEHNNKQSLGEPVPNLGDIQSTKFAIGDAVYIGNHTDRIGVIAFIGTTQFAQGEWIGTFFVGSYPFHSSCTEIFF